MHWNPPPHKENLSFNYQTYFLGWRWHSPEDHRVLGMFIGFDEDLFEKV